jgi:cell fate (sporulation/competence/biofilm development) regulator YlbF (YheA/YmcA/DUF963 family)
MIAVWRANVELKNASGTILLRFGRNWPMLTAMQTISLIDESVQRKTQELCEAIVQQPQFQSIRQRVDSFMADRKAQEQYQSLTEKGRSLHEKQHQGLPLDGREIAAFESERDLLLGNPVAKAFIDAQEEMNEMQEGVHKFIQKTFELGRLPAEEDLAEGSCGSGCGCHH